MGDTSQLLDYVVHNRDYCATSINCLRLQEADFNFSQPSSPTAVSVGDAGNQTQGAFKKLPTGCCFSRRVAMTRSGEIRQAATKTRKSCAPRPRNVYTQSRKKDRQADSRLEWQHSSVILHHSLERIVIHKSTSKTKW